MANFNLLVAKGKILLLTASIDLTLVILQSVKLWSQR